MREWSYATRSRRRRNTAGNLTRGGYNIDVLDLVNEGNAVLLRVKVVPGASRTRYLGEWDGRARIGVSAPPEKGKANAALCEFVVKQLRVDRRAVTLVSGETSPLKTLRIEGVSPDAVRAALASGAKKQVPPR